MMEDFDELLERVRLLKQQIKVASTNVEEARTGLLCWIKEGYDGELIVACVRQYWAAIRTLQLLCLTRPSTKRKP